jgi:hypothetical protein
MWSSGPQCRHQRRHHKYQSPRQESGHGDQSAGRGAPVSTPEMDATAKVNSKQQSIQSQCSSVAGPILNDKQEDRQRVNTALTFTQRSE